MQTGSPFPLGEYGNVPMGLSQREGIVMKKLTSVLCLLALMLSMLSGCGAPAAPAAKMTGSEVDLDIMVDE